MKRREFFKMSAPLVSAPFMLNGTSLSTFNSYPLLSTLNCQTIRERFVVIIQLDGGNDGFNTIRRDAYNPFYADKRPNLALTGLLNLDPVFDGIKLHGGMGGIQELCNMGMANIIESVGYPVMNRSHFKANDLWMTGGDGNNESLQQGWMGQYLEKIYGDYYDSAPGYSADPLGIQLKSASQSLCFHTNSEYLSSINLGAKNTDNYYKHTTEISLHKAGLSDIFDSDRVQFMKDLDQQAQLYGHRVTDVFNNGQNSYDNYPDTDIAHQLKTIARLVSGGSRTKIFLATLEGFDTHIDQQGKHADLLTQLSGAVNSFTKDLDEMALLDRALVVTFSEFGRKLIDNGTGSDHGTLAPMFVFGHESKINAGVSGPKTFDPGGLIDNQLNQGAPDLIYDNDGNPVNYKDYRDVFSSILTQWLGADDDAVSAAFGVYAGGTGLSFINNGVDLYGDPVEVPTDCYTTTEDPTNEFQLELPIISSTYDPSFGSGSGSTIKEPLQEISACDYVDLLPGFWAPCGSNVRIFPIDCSSIDNANLAVFTQPINEALSTEDVSYTAIREKEDAINLVEKRGEAERIRMSLFPNPAVDYINLKFSLREGERTIRLEVLDLKGAVVPVQVPNLRSSGGEYNIQLNIQHLTPGYYYVRYVSENLMETFKFIKT